MQIHRTSGSTKDIDRIPLDLNADKTFITYFQITTYIDDIDCRICHKVTDLKTNMHIKTIIHLLYKGHSGVLFSVSFLSAALLIEMLAGVHSRAKLLGLLLTCFINRIVTHEINISYTLVGPQALTSNYYHAEPFEMPSFNFTVCLWWKFNSPQMLTTQVNPALISIVSPGTCNNHYFIYYLYFEICIILKQS